MTNEQAVAEFNRVMSVYEVQCAYRHATSRKATRANLQRAIRLQDMALRAAGADGDFLTKPLHKLTRKEQDFMDAFNRY